MAIKINAKPLIERFSKYKSAPTKAYASAMRRWGNEVVDEMRRIVAYDTGRLHDSITFQEISETEFRIFTNDTAPYGIFIEFGTVKMQAQPFFFPVLNEWEPKLNKYIVEELQKELKK